MASRYITRHTCDGCGAVEERDSTGSRYLLSPLRAIPATGKEIPK
jgi:hypothetical protein